MKSVRSKLIVCGLATAIGGYNEPAVAQTGACCVTGGGVQFCSVETQDECTNLGGVYGGDGTQCTPFGGCIPDGPIGACCTPGTCFTSTEANCNGTWLGPDTECDPFPCELPAIGACCLEDFQFCFDTDEVQCANFKGTFHKGESCNSIKCGEGGGKEEVGACCALSPFGMSCIVASEESCLDSGGEFQGVGTTCDPSPCDAGTGPVGACCIIGGGAILCTILHESECLELNGIFQGEDTVCEPFPCSVPGDNNNDRLVNVVDLLDVIEAWGPCSLAGPCPCDWDDNSTVNVLDLLIVVSNWGDWN